MRKGFIFSHNKCVGCNACNAACILENGWTVHPRLIYTYNSDATLALPVVNLSLACNHCEKPLCLEGCPSGAYFREPLYGAIVIDDTKCIGCNYCRWNCPYDAPKFDSANRIIGKCNLCYKGLYENRLPACANACPTGALSFGEIPGSNIKSSLAWFPDKDINPAIEIKGGSEDVPLKIIPDHKFTDTAERVSVKPREMYLERSLIAFSFLITISVASLLSSLINGVFPNPVGSISMIILAGVVSLFHTGRIFRAWKAVLNIRSSPLSREIALYLLYLTLSTVALIFELPSILIVSSVTGLILLIVIDSVYIYADRRKSVMLHSGQTFLSSLLIVSFFTGNIIPFIFIALIKLASIGYNLKVNSISREGFGLRFLRIAILLISGGGLISGISGSDQVIAVLFLAGEFIDRIVFYIDFKPMNINTLINDHIKAVTNEKKRG
jgi:Fe-S-cluster-containing dehydrogenase component/DMSO reductase anchor subunit